MRNVTPARPYDFVMKSWANPDICIYDMCVSMMSIFVLLFWMCLCFYIYILYIFNIWDICIVLASVSISSPQIHQAEVKKVPLRTCWDSMRRWKCWCVGVACGLICFTMKVVFYFCEIEENPPSSKTQLGFDTRRSKSILRTFKSFNNIIALSSQISLHITTIPYQLPQVRCSVPKWCNNFP